MMIQNRDGLPDAIVEERRFFELYDNKKDATPKGWNTPENWKYLDDIPDDKMFGFAIGNGTNYLFIDGDHVRDPETGKLIPWVKDVYIRITKMAATYSETSMSGSGFHMVADLGDLAGNYGRESNGYDQIIIQMDPDEYKKLSKEEQDKIPKIEFWYHTDGRYAVLTGNHDRLIQVAKDEDAASIFSELLEVRKEFHAKYAKRAILDDAKIQIDEGTRKRILSALPYISASGREIWIRVGLALSNCGFPFEVWDEWSQFADQLAGELCDKYDPAETPKIWKSFKNTKSHWNAGTIFTLAKENGWEPPRSSKHQYDEQLIKQEFSDVSQARLFVSMYSNIVKYSKATGFLKYTGQVWEESELKAQRLSQELTDKQLKAVRWMLAKARREKDREAESNTPDAGNAAQAQFSIDEAEKIRKEIVKRRTSQRISATLTEAAPWLEIDVKELDADGFLLNTPGGTVDLKTGGMKQNDPSDYCTKITAVAPDAQNADLFDEFLDQITCEDQDLKRYLQEVAGVFAVGLVKREELYIATGSGGNGKSTYFNLIFMVLGDYAGTISSDVLIKNSRANKSNELAELRGKRMILAAELDEGAVLDAAMLKKLASKDPIHAEKKFKDPFDFRPSHSVVLYTNHLPSVSARDKGTWDRIIVLPFNARFRDTENEIKDYENVLFEKCGGAVLAWIIEGAKRYISNNFFIDSPESVKTAVDQYRTENDWLGAFIRARCLLDRSSREMAAALYRAYRNYCSDMGEFPKHSSDFKKALESIGIRNKKTKTGAVYIGLRLKDYTELKSDESKALKEDIS